MGGRSDWIKEVVSDQLVNHLLVVIWHIFGCSETQTGETRYFSVGDNIPKKVGINWIREHDVDKFDSIVHSDDPWLLSIFIHRWQKILFVISIRFFHGKIGTFRN